MPVYAIFQILSTPASTASSPQQLSAETVLQWKVLPYSITLGYIIPTILSCWPLFSPKTHRIAVLLWGCYPLYILLCQKVLTRSIAQFKPSPPSKKSKDETTHAWKILQSTYVFGIRCIALTYVWSMTLLLTCYLFPSIFTTQAIRELSFRDVLFPTWPPAGLNVKGQNVDSLLEGFHILLKWDLLTGCWAGAIMAICKLWDTRLVSFTSSFPFELYQHSIMLMTYP